MTILRRYTIRICMTCLFCMALFVTFQAFSGVAVSDIEKWYKQKDKTVIKHVAAPQTIAEEEKKIKAEETTKPLEQSIDWSKFRSVEVMATGYTAGIESTGKHPNHPQYGITYSGVRVKRDLYSTIAADLKVFPVGTILFIPGYGYGVVADKGGAIKGHSLDLYYETVTDVYNQWGKRKVKVYIVKQGNGKLTEQELTHLNEDESMQVFRQQYLKK